MWEYVPIFHEQVAVCKPGTSEQYIPRVLRIDGTAVKFAIYARSLNSLRREQLHVAFREGQLDDAC